VGEQAGFLMEEYKTISAELKQAAKGGNFNRKYRAIKKKENKFRKDVIILEYHYKMLEDAYRFQGGNILLQYIKFGFACLSVLLTLLWIIHCALYVIPQTLKSQGVAINPVDGFLNNMLKLTADVPVVGIALYSMFVFYLMACTMKGNAKLGMRLVFFTIHPLV
jgi:LMBR1 domain-containing protein 1